MLKDKVILVAGGSGGIGSAIVERCAAAGARVWAGYSTNATGARDACAKAQKLGAQASAVELNVRNPGSIATAVGEVIRTDGRIDGIVNAVGIHVAGPLMGLAEDDVRSQIDVNLTGAIWLAQAVLPTLVKQRSGSIVLLGSVAAHRMVRGHAVYSATKAGLEGFARALAAEVAKRQVRVNCVLPGPVPTPMLQRSIQETGDQPQDRVPMGRTIRSEEVADAVVYLLSDRAASITGAAIPVDGGYLLW